MYIESLKNSGIFLKSRSPRACAGLWAGLGKAWESFNLSPVVDLEPLNKQEVKAIKE